ncbi:flagellar protein FliT [bacterium]|nr:flagellar protein FliT [bacterium]
MEREAELVRLYDEAMELTRLQADAIAQDEWDTFVQLLDDREACITEAERLLEGPTLPANRSELRTKLAEIQALDLQNQAVFQRKRHTLMRELNDIDRSANAVSGYRDAFGAPETPQFFDHDQ